MNRDFFDIIREVFLHAYKWHIYDMISSTTHDLSVSQIIRVTPTAIGCVRVQLDWYGP